MTPRIAWHVRVALFALAMLLGLAAAEAAPISAAWQTAQTPTTGYIDPTVASYNSSKPIVCTSSTTPSATLTEQNRATFEFALADATATGKWIYLPPCNGYPITHKTGSTCGVDFSGASNVSIYGYGAVVRGVGTIGSGEYDMFCIETASHIRIYGLTFSMRDTTATSDQTHMVELGKTTTAADDILIADVRFTEPATGDCLRVLGSSTATITRVNVVDTVFDGCERSGISFQRGYQFFNAYNDYFTGTQKGQDIDNEPTADGLIGNLVVADNFIDRTTSPNGTSISIAGNDGSSLIQKMWIVDNVFQQAYPAGGLNASQIWVSGNVVIYDQLASQAAELFELLRRAYDVWCTDNVFMLGSNAQSNPIIGITEELSDCLPGAASPDCIPHDVWITGNRLQQYGVDDAISLDTVTNAWVTENNITYHNGSNFVASPVSGMSCVRWQTDGSAVQSGWLTENRCRRDVQADGSSSAGTMLAGLALIIHSAGTFGHTTIRDNLVDGANAFLRSNAAAATLSEGQFVIGGNTSLNNTNFVTNGIATWTGETTPDNEAVASGAVAPARRTSVLTTASAGTTYTLADCAQGGITKHLKIPTVGGGGDGTLTPTHFGDGTSLHWTAPGWADLACDGTTWWLLGHAAGVTVIP